VRARLAVAVFLLGCPGAGRGKGPPLADTQGTDEPVSRGSLLRDLEAEVLDGYDRDEPLDVQLRVIDPVVGAARIGVGPGDVWVGEQVGLATSRWPLATDRTTDLDVKSKKLELHLAADQSAAWVSDEVSWRITACDRVAVIPLRFTALYVRDGDRWSAVVEHLSYGRPLSAEDHAGFGVPIEPAVADPAIAEALDAGLTPLLLAARPAALDLTPEAFALGPDVWDELRTGSGSDELAATPLWPRDLRIEQRRVGLVERGGGKTTIAYWVGTLLAPRPDVPATAQPEPPDDSASARTPVRDDADAQAVRLRATFVFERTGTSWALAQAHLSLPTDDAALAGAAFGGSLAGLNPLRVTCPPR
jgi:ketosteroid isomerase-like protein